MTIIGTKKKKRKPFPFQKKKKLLSSASEPLTLKDTVTKWSGFYSQVSELSITGAGLDEGPEVSESDFFRRLRDATEENFSGTFQTFAKVVFHFRSKPLGNKNKRTTDFTDCTQSLPIFLYNREHIYSTLIQALEKKELSDLGSLYNVSVGFFVDASLTKEVGTYFDGFMRVFESSLQQRSDASVVQVIFQSLLSIVKELLKNSSLTPNDLTDKLLYLFDSKKYPDYVVDFSSVVLAPVLRKNKFSPEGVFKSILATKCPDGIVKTLGRSIKNFGSNFFAGAEAAWSNFLEGIQDASLLEELHDFIINSEPSVKEFEPLVKLTLKAFLSNPLKFSPSFNKLLLRKKAKYVPGDYIVSILKSGLSDKLFESDGGGMIIVKSLLSLSESKAPEAPLKNFIRSVLSGRPRIISEFSMEDDKFDYLVLPLFVESCSLLSPDEEDILPYVESLASVIMEASDSSSSSHQPNYKVIEFSTDQPNSLKTFPNRVVALLNNHETRESSLKALLGLRPLNKSHILPKLKELLKSEFKDNEVSFFLTYLCNSLLSKAEFIQMTTDLRIVEKLLEVMKGERPSLFSFQMLNILCSAGVAINQNIFDTLMPHLSVGESKVRLCIYDSWIKIHSNEEEKSLLKYAFEAENMSVDLSNYKERLRLLNYLERRLDGEEDSLRSSSSLEEMRIRALLSNLMVNFSLMWEPIVQLVLSFPKNSTNEELFWKVYFEVLGKSYEQINNSPEDSAAVDYVNYRNYLLKICESCPGTELQKWNRHFVSNFLDKFLVNEFNRRRSDKEDESLEEEMDVSQPEEETNDSTKPEEETNDSTEPEEETKEADEEMEENEVDMEVDVEKTDAKAPPQYFKAVKNVSKSLSHHLKVFSRMSNLRSVYRFSELREFIVQNLLSDPFLENRKMALDFITVAENKNIRQAQRDVLSALTDKKGWKSSLRDFVQKYNEENNVYSPIAWISNRFISGMLKETRHMKRTPQMSTRKTIMEIISKFKDFEDILNSILDDIGRTTFWELGFDILLISRQYLSTSDNLAQRAVKTVEKNLPYTSGDIKSKQRYKVIEVYTRLIQTLRNQYLWPLDKKKQFMETCILPLFIDIYERRLLSKNALVLFKALIQNSLEWVVLKTSKNASLLDHILKDFLENKSFDGSDFCKLNLNVLCRILQRLVTDEEEGLSESEKVLISKESLLLKANLALPIIASINLKANIDDINLRLIALKGLIVLFPTFILSKQELHKLCDHVASKIRFSSPELQSDCLQIILIALKKLKSGEDQLPISVFKLIPKIIDPNQKSKYVETVFSLVTDNSKAEFKGHEIAYDICQNMESLMVNNATSSCLKMFLFYNALGEVKRSEFANRRVGSNCMLSLLKNDAVELIRNHVLPEIVATLGNTKSSVETTTEMITILQFLIKEYSEDSIEDLRFLSRLTNVHDMDEDFYANMKHLQTIRHSRAIKRMAKKIIELEEEEGRLSDGYIRVIFDYIYPLCSAVLFNEKTTKYSELIESSIDLIGSLAQRCDFSRYKKILMYYLSMERPSEEMHSTAFAKQRIKLIGRVLDAFHFESQTVDFLLSKVFTIIDSGGDQGYENASHEVLYLPIVKLLQLNKSPSKDEYTSRIIVKLAKGLRMREFTTRERIRSTLNSIARLLGHNYFAYIIEILESSLKRGYELHVLIYSIKSMLMACSKDLQPGHLDSILPAIMKFTRLELFQSIKEEKSVSKIRTQTPEAKKTSSFSSIEVLAKFASRSISMNVIRPIGDCLHEFKSFEALENIRKLFKHMSDGLTSNESLQTLDLLAIVHSVLSERIFQSPSSEEQSLSSRQTTILIEFALQLLTRVLNGKSNLESADFESFIPIIIDKSKKVRDTEVISLTVSIFSRLVHMSESFRDLVPVNDVFTLIVRALIVESLYSKEQDKVRFQDLAASFLNGYLDKGGKFNSEDKESVKLFLQYILDSKSIGSRTAKLLGAVIKQGSMSELNKAILERLCKDYVESVDVNLVRTISSAIINYLKSDKNADWVLQFLLQQFNYSGEKGRLRAMKMMSDIMSDGKIKTKNTSYVSIFVMVAKSLSEEKTPACIETLRSILNSLRCSEKDAISILTLLEAWTSGADSNNLIIGAKIIFQISKTENKSLISVIQDLSDQLKAFVERDDHSMSKILVDHVKVDFLTSLYKTCKKKNSAFFVWLLPYIDRYIMNSKSSLRRLAIELLSYVMSEVPSVMNAAAIEENKGIFRQILLNLMEVLKLNLSICEEDLFEKVSLALIYFSKTTDPMLILGKLIGVARYEVEHLPFSYKRREILFTVVGVLSSRGAVVLSANMLRSVLKMGRALIEHEETTDMVEELYNKLEASTKDPDSLTLIQNTRNRVDIMEGKLKRKAPHGASTSKKKKT